GFDGAGDGQILRYDYSLGDFAFAVSLEQTNNGAETGLTGDADPGELVYGIGFRYGVDVGGGVRLNFGLGYQACDNCDIVGASVDARFDNGLRAILNYSQESVDTAAEDTDRIGFAIGYSIDALTIAANYGNIDDGTTDTTGYGAVINYDLGGGAEVQFGVGNTDADGADDVTSYSLGLALSF
ncbi:MAG: porin, partial [Pseudomonadota bacterium]